MCRVHTAAGKGEAAGIAQLSYRAGEKLWKTPFSPTSDPPPPPEIMLTGCYEVKQANKRGLDNNFWYKMQPNGWKSYTYSPFDEICGIFRPLILYMCHITSPSQAVFCEMVQYGVLES